MPVPIEKALSLEIPPFEDTLESLYQAVNALYEQGVEDKDFGFDFTGETPEIRVYI